MVAGVVVVATAVLICMILLEGTLLLCLKLNGWKGSVLSDCYVLKGNCMHEGEMKWTKCTILLDQLAEVSMVHQSTTGGT